MRGRILWAAAIVCLLPCTGWAQDGLRSAALPEGGLTLTVPPERDLFLVEPDFYTRRVDRGPSVLVFPYYVPTPYWYIPSSADVHTRSKTASARREAIRQPRELPSTPNLTLPPVVPGVPKTFYIIPGCYAGDIPPLPEWLPRGCDPSRMRVIRPR